MLFRTCVLALMMFACGRADATAERAQSLGQWMKSNASPALEAKDFGKLATVFDGVTTRAPEEQRFRSWPAIATAGRRAAGRRDMEGVRHACRSCHDAHRAAFRARESGRSLEARGRDE